MKISLKTLFALVFTVFPFADFFAHEVNGSVQTEKPEIPLEKITTYIETPIVEQRQVYFREEIQKMNVLDLPSFFQAAGIQVLSYGAYGLEQKPSIRGFTDETVRVVIDGVCANNPQYGTFDFSSLNPEIIEKIEIVRGGFTEGVSDDGGVAGVIYITTKNQALGKSFFADTRVKTYFNAQKFLDTVSQSLSYRAQVSENSFLKASAKATYAQNEYLYKNYRNRTASRKDSQVKDAHADFGFSHFFGGGNVFSVGDIFYAADKHTPGTETSGRVGLQQDYNNSLNFSLNFPAIMESVKSSTSLNWMSSNRFYTENSASSESRHCVNTVTLTSSADFYRFERYRQSAGFTFDLVFLDSTDDGRHSQISGTFKETSRFIFNDFVSVGLPLSFKFSGKNVAFTPKAGVKFAFDCIDLFLNAYRMVQFPNMDDLYWKSDGYSGNPDLSPETGWGGELTFNVKKTAVPFSVSFFSNYYENKIQWANLDGDWKPQNVASAFYLGCDLSAEKTFFKVWRVRANAEYLYNRLMDESNESTYGKRIMWTPDLVFSLVTGVDLKNFTINAEANYTGKKYTSNINTVFVEPYCIVNLTGEFSAFDFFVPYFRIDNLFNVDYRAVPGYPMPGFSFTLGVKSKWHAAR